MWFNRQGSICFDEYKNMKQDLTGASRRSGQFCLSLTVTKKLPNEKK